MSDSLEGAINNTSHKYGSRNRTPKTKWNAMIALDIKDAFNTAIMGLYHSGTRETKHTAVFN